MTNIVKDNKFRLGFNVLRRSLLENNKTELLEIPFTKERPIWRLAEYFSKYDLYTYKTLVSKDNYYSISNQSKEIISDEEGRLTLKITTDNEYDHDRVDGEAWPHLLIEQEFEDQYISQMSKLVVSMDLDFLALESFMNQTRNELHTFQVSLYFAICDKNPNSKGFNDFYWFGLPLIDCPRYRFPKEWVSQDIGKEDCTNKLIYSIDPHLYLKDQFLVGDNAKFSIDVLSYMVKAFNKAKELGYLKYSKFEDMGISSLNFGFEVTGTFNGKIRLNDFKVERE